MNPLDGRLVGALREYLDNEELRALREAINELLREGAEEGRIDG